MSYDAATGAKGSCRRLIGCFKDPDMVCLMMACGLKKIVCQFEDVPLSADGHACEVRWVSSGQIVQGLCPIIEVLENHWPHPELLPYQRVALDCLWDKISFLKSQVVPVVNLFWQAVNNASKVFESKTELERLLDQTELELGQQGFWCGDSLTLADLFAYPMVKKLFDATQDALPICKFPNLNSWNQRLTEYCSFIQYD